MKSSRVAVALLTLLIAFVAVPVDGRQTTVRDLYRVGEEAMLRGDFYGAIESFKLALARNPKYLEPVVGLAESFFFLGEYSEALDYVLRAQELDRGNPDLLNLEGRIRVGLGDFEAAAALFDRVLEQQPNNLDAWFGMAELDLAFGKTTRASERYEQALRVSPQNRRALLSLILILDEQGKRDDAAVFVEDALRYHPRNAQVRFIAAKHYRREGDLAEAEYQALRALEIDPGNREAKRLLGEIYLESGAYERALGVLEELIGAEREQPLVWYTLGVAYRALGRVEEAMNAFAFAFRYQSDDEIARLSLERLITDTLSLDDPRRSRFARYHFALGKQYQERNFLDRALRSYRRGLLIDPHSREGRLRYAEVFRLKGYSAKYLNELKVLLDLGYEEPAILDSVEIQESLRKGSVSEVWGVDQYALVRQVYVLDVFVAEAQTRHPAAEGDLGEYFRSLLRHRERIRVPRAVRTGVGFGEAFGAARSNKSDYFLTVDFVETERRFAAHVAVYGARTGELLDEFQVVRTGNRRVSDALNLLADRIDSILPIAGELIDREFDTALIDLGRWDGVAEDDEWLIIKRSALSLATDRVGFFYKPDDVIGTFTVTRTDELISEGTLAQSRFFDLVNIGDKVIYERTDEAGGEIETPAMPSDLYRRIIAIR